ncbi:protein of unknown function DUF847 [Alkalidesulfovibrio alkalitolerans DSM 16529]|uniref:Uncharacterized protein n=1 Tax=Alkalidesulfovibrio alkalitolerans DSM 16529 TaxID=1121439 RepID=S7UTC3_9BACT|nr:glycosyl hydrolase 108 family protein [Alkalidesulfovibrio alkalitolerans]EPR35583.1 protein of unknown function DUF847 [Alkalidesulfovibrio alkalitolerans DSM 16529]
MKKNYNPPPQIFDAAFLLIVAAEGGEKVSDDPRDPGGLTKWGICQRSYPDLDIRALTESDAREIYRRDYWDACKCDELPWPLSLYVFDAAINQGVSAAARMLQEAADVTVDGKIGPKTLAAAKSHPEWRAVRFMALRAMRYSQTKNFDRFGMGWLTRIFALAQEV